MAKHLPLESSTGTSKQSRPSYEASRSTHNIGEASRAISKRGAMFIGKSQKRDDGCVYWTIDLWSRDWQL